MDPAAVAVPKAAPVPVGKTFRAFAPDQMLLLPPSLDEWLPEDHLARFVAELVDEVLDLSPVLASYTEKRGYPPYDPRLMVRLLIYGYTTGVRSSRAIERKCIDDVAFRYLSAGAGPDYRSISRFRARHLDALAEIFTQSLHLAQKLGMVKMGRVALDGTKLQANASKRKAMSHTRLVDKEERIEAEIAELEAAARSLLDDAEAVDAAEDKERRRQNRSGGHDPGAVEAAGRDGAATARPKDKAQANFTDPDSRIMKNGDGAYIQAYNAQAVVDDAHQIITAADLTTNPADALNYTTMLDQSAANTGTHARQVLADAGYCSEANLAAAASRKAVHGTDTFMATGRLAHDEKVNPAPRGRIPADATLRERMARKLRTKPGRAAYARRKAIVEPVFGQIMTCQDGRRLLLRGEAGARAEWQLLAACHNLRKIFGHTGAAGPAAARA